MATIKENKEAVKPLHLAIQARGDTIRILKFQLEQLGTQQNTVMKELRDAQAEAERSRMLHLTQITRLRNRHLTIVGAIDTTISEINHHMMMEGVEKMSLADKEDEEKKPEELVTPSLTATPATKKLNKMDRQPSPPPVYTAPPSDPVTDHVLDISF